VAWRGSDELLDQGANSLTRAHRLAPLLLVAMSSASAVSNSLSRLNQEHGSAIGLLGCSAGGGEFLFVGRTADEAVKASWRTGQAGGRRLDDTVEGRGGQPDRRRSGNRKSRAKSLGA
jgi:hypothetical protein